LAGDVPISCGNCSAELPPGFWRGEEFLRCSRCGQPVSVTVFPTLLRGPEEGQTGEHRLEGDQAACFFHADRAAVRACDHCGRFVCALCDLDFGRRHACPACLESAEDNKDIPLDIERKRICYEEIAFMLAAVPLILGFCVWWIWIVTGPAAIFTALWFWRRSSKFGSSGTLKRLLAILIGAGEVVVWLLVFLNTWGQLFPYAFSEI
jgi:hypothetical protein